MTMLLNLLIAANAFAGDIPSGKISCETEKNPPKNAFQAKYTLTGRLTPFTKEEATIRDVVMTAASEDDLSDVVTGRRAWVAGEVSPRARKYTNHYNFDMKKLIDTEDFGDFLPMDSCSIHVKIPNNATFSKTFQAAVVTNCDQSGGSQTMDCSFVKDAR